MPTKLRPNWYETIIDHPAALGQAGVYEWRIEGVGVYVGKAKALRSRLRHYPNNVRRMIDGAPWHGNPNKDYRPVHYALRLAYEAGLKVTVSVLEVCHPDDRAAREKVWIAQRRDEEAKGGPKVLNVPSSGR